MNHVAVYKFDRHKDKLTPTNMIPDGIVAFTVEGQV